MWDRGQISDTSADDRRFWCDYRMLEEYHAGMWRTIADEKEQVRLIAASVAVLRSPPVFLSAARGVLSAWPVSARTELTSPGFHRAWLGQAACCFSRGVPESLTRRAWWKLTERERCSADDVADGAIMEWRERNPQAGHPVQLGLFSGAEEPTGRFYCDYRELEEWKAGMWKHVSCDEERARLLAGAVALLRDHEAFTSAMRRALHEWPTSCLFNFTNPSLNKPVWLAHAGAALVSGIPEEFMRLGYWELTEEEKARADADAAECFSEWRDPRAQAVP